MDGISEQFGLLRALLSGRRGIVALGLWVAQAALFGWPAVEKGGGAAGWGVLALMLGPLAVLAVGFTPAGRCGAIRRRSCGAALARAAPVR